MVDVTRVPPSIPDARTGRIVGQDQLLHDLGHGRTPRQWIARPQGRLACDCRARNNRTRCRQGLRDGYRRRWPTARHWARNCLNADRPQPLSRHSVRMLAPTCMKLWNNHHTFWAECRNRCMSRLDPTVQWFPRRSTALCRAWQPTSAVHQVPREVLGRSLVIQGTGPSGLLAIAVALVAGAGWIVAVGAPDARLDLAKSLRADVVLSIERSSPAGIKATFMDLAQGRGADVAMEFTGNPQAF